MTRPAADDRRVRAVFERPTLEVADAILGWRLIRLDGEAPRVGRIVEVEAYIGEDDQASHARFGRTDRNAIMYGPPGRAYVYLVYGMHDCLNIVTEAAGRPAALLVRAIEPLVGADVMRAARTQRAAARRHLPERAPGVAVATAASVPTARIASGPGLVCAAFGIDRSLTGLDLLDPAAAVHLEPPLPDEPRPEIVASPRVGVGYAGPVWASIPWRRSIAANGSVSRPRPARSAG